MSEKKNSSILDGFRLKKSIFIIGTASSAHQVEGCNQNDWTEFEKQNGKIARGEKSGLACDHYNRYKEDFKMLNDLGFRAHRLSIEWSRIVPKEGLVDSKEIEHYQDVLLSLRKNRQVSFVTLHHFTSPIWFMKRGGFEKKENLKYWAEYVKIVCSKLGKYIDVFNTINEPYVYCVAGYFQGIHSPGKKSLISYMKVGNNLMRAHFIAVSLIRRYCQGKQVGLVKNLVLIKPYRKWNPIDQLIAKFFDWGFNSAALKALKKKKIPFGFSNINEGDVGDFIGINHYNIFIAGIGIKDLMIPHFPGEKRLTNMNWGVYPKALTSVLVRAHEITKLPIYITENGIATNDDNWRQEIILAYLNSVLVAINKGVNIKGYFYWSNMDNFEWAEGFLRNGGFGLIEVNFDTLERKPRESARILGKLSRKLNLK